MIRALKLLLSFASMAAGLYLIGVGYTVRLAIPVLNTIVFVGGIGLCGGGFIYFLITLRGQSE